MSLVFHYAPFSSAFTCLWAFEELGIPHERVKLDLAAKATRTPEFLALNPNGKVPLLVHDGAPIFESIAILAHLGETFGVEKGLFPAPGIDRARAFQWLAWANASVAPAISLYLTNTADRFPAELQNAKVADAAKKEVSALLAILDEHLTGRTWLVGETFTLVDVHLAGLVWWAGRLGFDTKALSALDAWSARCQARPGFAASTKG